MCSGYFLDLHALAPVYGKPTGSFDPGPAISKENARISVAWCVEQMKKIENLAECSKQFVGVSGVNGACFCATYGGDCRESNNDIKSLRDAKMFFKLSLPLCNINDESYIPGGDCECSFGYKGIMTLQGNTYSGICTAGGFKKFVCFCAREILYSQPNPLDALG